LNPIGAGFDIRAANPSLSRPASRPGAITPLRRGLVHVVSSSASAREIPKVHSPGALPAAERARVRSWIFRNRLRLRAIYGQRPQVTPMPGGKPREPRPLADGLVPGQAGRRGRWYVIRPLPPAASPPAA
jgi:hypothetical protein